MATAPAVLSMELLTSVGLEKQPQILKNPELSARISKFIGLAGGAGGCSKEVGTLLYKLATEKLAKDLSDANAAMLCSYVSALQIKSWPQLEAALKYLSKNDTVNKEQLEQEAGVGVEISDADVKRVVSDVIIKLHAQIEEKRYFFPPGLIIKEVNANAQMKWADGKVIKTQIDAQLLELLGPKTDADNEKKPKPKKEKEPKKEEAKKEEAKAEEEVPLKFLPPEENKGEGHFFVQSEEHLKAHIACTKGNIVTRFPPEPNGHLHIGHAKAMNMNFNFANKYFSHKEGNCIMRFDDTNPSAEKQDYIDNILNDVKWMGHTWSEVTYSSDYFQQLYDLAVLLVKQGNAYVCFQTSEQVRDCRKMIADSHIAKKPIPVEAISPWRDSSVEQNLTLFEQMKMGLFNEGECNLRMKGDLSSDNPNNWDFSAYRIKYSPHPHAGDKWVIYPTYDYTHCLCDSLENITHSLCTLEFESRQAADGPYYWILERLNLYKPQTWEYSRLNITNNVLSKRKLNKLVTDKHVSGWDDPRLLTISGLRRRGFTSAAINKFCDQIGVTKNENMIKDTVLSHCVRLELDETCNRAMVVLEPLKLVITNWTGGPEMRQLPNHPKDESKGTRTVALTAEVFIEHTDFRLEDSKDYFGLAPSKSVGLKYAYIITCTEVLKNDNGVPVEVRCTMDKQSAAKPKTYIHWVSADPKQHTALAAVNLYDKLFNIENPAACDDWLDHVNPESLVVKASAVAENVVSQHKPGQSLQFERLGFFVVDKDSTTAKPIFNRIVPLKDSKPKDAK